jgi:hypothetical protein
MNKECATKSGVRRVRIFATLKARHISQMVTSMFANPASQAKRISTQQIKMMRGTSAKNESLRNGVTFIEKDQDIRYKTATIVASTACPQGVFSMGAFPSSLIALGRLRRQYFDDALTLRTKRDPMNEGPDPATHRNERAYKANQDIEPFGTSRFAADSGTAYLA